MNLFTIPYAGGSANYYSRWKRMINKNIAIVPIEFTGRGKRTTEALYNNIYEAVDDIFKQIKKGITCSSYALFGHSMGALICFELAYLIQDRKLPMPNHIFISGRHAPRLKNDDKAIHLFEKNDFIKEIMAMGGTDKEIFEHAELANYFIPIIKNDLRIVYEYQFEQERIPLDCDFSIFTGKEESYSTEQIMGWSKYTTGYCKFYKFDGGHFFINTETEKIISIINQTLN